MGFFMQGVNSKVADAMDLMSLESKVRANNIANANTKGYKAREVDFSTVLQEEEGRHIQLARTNARHIDSSDAFHRDPSRFVHDTGREVEVDEEIVKMTKANMQYQTMTHMLANRFQLFSSIIRGRVD